MSEYSKQKPETIQKMFGTIAKRYDFTNSVLSFQMHKIWNKRLVKEVLGSYCSKDDKLLIDLCSGTGEISFEYLKNSEKNQKIYMIDFCQEMLDCAKDKGVSHKYDQNHELKYIQADVQKLPLTNDYATHATMAYGIRNVKDPLICMQEVHRVLKQGGKFGILELTQPENRVLRFGHQIYLRVFLPILGKLVTSNKAAYEYLCNSIHHFIKPQNIELMMQKAGFVRTYRVPLCGGIAHIVYGEKQ